MHGKHFCHILPKANKNISGLLSDPIVCFRKNKKVTA